MTCELVSFRGSPWQAGKGEEARERERAKINKVNAAIDDAVGKRRGKAAAISRNEVEKKP